MNKLYSWLAFSMIVFGAMIIDSQDAPATGLSIFICGCLLMVGMIGEAMNQ